MSDIHIRQLPAELGNGSDGALHIQTDTEMAQGEYNLTSLTIDTGSTWAPNKPASRGLPTEVADYVPIVIIRCLTPIILNGIISMSEVTRCMSYTDMNPLINGPVAFGYNATPRAYNYSGGGAVGPGDTPIWEGANTSLVGFNDDFASLSAIDEWEGGGGQWPRQFYERWIGPNRPFRHGLGGVGRQGLMQYSNIYGGRGGGHIEIYAPDIVGSGEPSVYAQGEDGQNGDYEDFDGFGSGGGGGGTILLFTMATPRTMYAFGVTPGMGGSSDYGGGPGSGPQGGSGMWGYQDWRQLLC